MWKLICEMGGNMRVKSLYAYDIKNDIVDGVTTVNGNYCTAGIKK